jgi:hypothetical protein
MSQEPEQNNQDDGSAGIAGCCWIIMIFGGIVLFKEFLVAYGLIR